jgi:hypothetical protein
VSFDDSTVGGNDISILEQDNISWNDLSDRNSLGSGTGSIAGSSNNSSLRSTNRFERSNSLEK